tara:strand:+ start:1106 stop:1324 length:219 start_codon:yes stop_codon:yes gene_type:complete
MSSSSKSIKRKGLIVFYKKLLKENRIKQYGAARQRLKQLEERQLQKTRWFGVRYRSETNDNNSLGLATKDLN